MAPTKTAKTAAATEKTTKPVKHAKKEKIFHPSSRKAGQLQRKNIRQDKLGGQSSVRSKRNNEMANVYGFFYHSLPPTGEMSLVELHELIRDNWLSRHDEELAEEKAARRKGRPKSTREMKLEEAKLRESEEYRTGIDVIDLTHPANVRLFRQWDQKEVAFIDLLRFLRISSTDTERATVSRPGKHFTLVPDSENEVAADSVMQVDS
ncbi:hypothetical protein CYLTODRAFT_377721 [Cylindrobasidium torrendii FP15055 ss-10]|uniref:Translation machinery-associated protein 16 n=1 Tax=Cylindrobasidium torrendii FP15055 ss-10 TaxID=1314674 RepID=A0A0D7B865_9AGAR|nr:hypothetical protein CYLTODRAFT_377721 [Cylindrobasidium torrendii FP15055 ss-10]